MKNINETHNNKILDIVDRVTKTVGDSIQYSIANIGTAFLPLVSGSLFAIGIYNVFITETSSFGLSIAMAIVFAIGLESVGFNSSKRMVQNPNILTIGFFFVYIIVGGASLWLTDVSTSHAMITSSAFLLTAINYGLYGLRERDLSLSRTLANREDTSDKKESDHEQMLYDRKQAEKESNWQRKMKTNKINATIKNGQTTDKQTDKRQTTNDNSTETTDKPKRFDKLTDKDRTMIGQMTTKEIVKVYLISTRTAQRWLNTLNKENK